MSIAIDGRGKQVWRRKELMFVGKKSFRKKTEKTHISISCEVWCSLEVERDW